MQRSSATAIAAPPLPKGSLGKQILRQLKDFSSLLWKFSKKLMWFSSTSKQFIKHTFSVYHVFNPSCY